MRTEISVEFTRFVSKPALVTFLTVLVGLSAAQEAAAEEDPPEKDKRVMVVGTLAEQFRSVCKKEMEEEWVDPHFEAGFVTLIPAIGIELRPMLGKAVVAHGRVAPNARTFRAEGGGWSCIQMQARSDWMFNKGGFRMVRPLPQGVAWAGDFEVDKVAQLQGLDVKRVGDELEVSFENTLGIDLVDVEIMMHYEGCYGKPGTDQQSKTFPTIKTGAKEVARFPVLIKEDPNQEQKYRRGPHSAASLQVSTKTPSVIMDLDVWLSAFGDLKLGCPKN